MHQQELPIDNREFDRRISDIKDHANTKGRIAVLEKIAETHGERISDIEEFHRSVVERFDQKIQLDVANQIAMERIMTKAVVSIDSLAINLGTALDTAKEAATLAVKHETIARTITKAASVLVVVISAMWTILSYFGVI